MKQRDTFWVLLYLLRSMAKVITSHKSNINLGQRRVNRKERQRNRRVKQK